MMPRLHNPCAGMHLMSATCLYVRIILFVVAFAFAWKTRMDNKQMCVLNSQKSDTTALQDTRNFPARYVPLDFHDIVLNRGA